jgi:membrane protein implicated in regulation of membrane protease activity
MFEEFFSSGALNFVYAAAVIVSFVFAIVTLLGAEFGDALDFDADVDADSGVEFLSISPFGLAMFGAAFGLTGLITRLWFDMNTGASLVWAVVVGLGVGVLAQALFLYVFSPSKSSHYSLAADAVGRDAQVIVTVPNEGLGKIAFDNVSGRVTLGARSVTGKRIMNGEAVRIEQITGRVALVRPVDDEKWLYAETPESLESLKAPESLKVGQPPDSPKSLKS